RFRMKSGRGRCNAGHGCAGARFLPHRRLNLRAAMGTIGAVSLWNPPMSARYASFREFYPFYLSEHADKTCRRLHFIGSSVALACLVAAILMANGWWLLAALLSGYAFAWTGHFFSEKNRPA